MSVASLASLLRTSARRCARRLARRTVTLSPRLRVWVERRVTRGATSGGGRRTSQTDRTENTPQGRRAKRRPQRPPTPQHCESADRSLARRVGRRSGQSSATGLHASADMLSIGADAAHRAPADDDSALGGDFSGDDVDDLKNTSNAMYRGSELGTRGREEGAAVAGECGADARAGMAGCCDALARSVRNDAELAGCLGGCDLYPRTRKPQSRQRSCTVASKTTIRTGRDIRVRAGEQQRGWVSSPPSPLEQLIRHISHTSHRSHVVDANDGRTTSDAGSHRGGSAPITRQQRDGSSSVRSRG